MSKSKKTSQNLQSDLQQVEWKSRVGFAKIALEAKVPIIPVFTKNIRESVRTISCGRPLMKWIYDKTRHGELKLDGA